MTDTPAFANDCFALPPGVHWTPVDEALALLRDRMTCVAPVQQVALQDALGRITAASITANRANPPAANAAVDGYGFAYGSMAAGGPFEVPLMAGRSAAGAPLGQAVPAGQAVRILTGAVLPEGVDTIVMQEDVAVSDGGVRFGALPKAGANTRPAGEDRQAGAPLLTAGHILRAPDLAALAATGHGTVPVRARLRVGVLSTGDELVVAGALATDAQTYDANGPMLRAMLAGWGMEVVDLGRAPDTVQAVRAALDAAAVRCDAILTSGGASGGDEDHVSALLTAEGQRTLWRIAVKPGRPLAMGVWRGVPVFGLPGNPVAAFVTAAVFARPGLCVMAGAGWRMPVATMMPALFEKTKKAGRREYLRARVTDAGVETFGSEGSGRIWGLSWADALVELPDAAMTVRPGDHVRVLRYADLLTL